MKRLNRDISALLNNSNYKFVWQEKGKDKKEASLSDFPSLEEIRNKYSTEHLNKSLQHSLKQITGNIAGFEASEARFYESQKAVDLLESSASRLTKDTQSNLGKRIGYRVKRAKGLKGLRKDRKNKAKALKISEKDFKKTYKQERGRDFKSLILARDRMRGFVENMTSLDTDIATLEDRYHHLAKRVTIKQDSKNEFREIQRRILEESKMDTNSKFGENSTYDAINKSLEYLGISNETDPVQLGLKNELKMVGDSIIALKEIRHDPKLEKALLLALSKNIPVRILLAGYKNLINTADDEINDEADKEEAKKKIEEIKKELKETSAFKDIETDWAGVKARADEVKTLEQEINVLKAKPYQTDTVKADIKIKEENKATVQTNTTEEKQAVKTKATGMIATLAKSYNQNAEVVAKSAHSFVNVIKDNINNVQDEINKETDPTKLNDAREKLKQLQDLLQTLEQKNSVEDVVAAQALFTDADSKKFITEYQTSVDRRDDAKFKLSALKELFTEDGIDFDRTIKTESDMNYNSIVKRETEKIKKDAEAERETLKVEAEKKRTEDDIERREKADEFHKELRESPEFESFLDSENFGAYIEEKDKLSASNEEINYLLALIARKKTDVRLLAFPEGGPDDVDEGALADAKEELKDAKAALAEEKEKRSDTLQHLDNHLKALIGDRNKIIVELRDEIQKAKEERKAANNEPAKKVANDKIKAGKVTLRELTRMMNAEINSVKDISYLLASDEIVFREYLTKVIKDDGSSFVTFDSYTRSRKTGTLTGSAGDPVAIEGSPRSGVSSRASSSRSSADRLKAIDKTKIADYLPDYRSEEVAGLTTAAQIKARVNGVVAEKSMQNEVIRLLNLKQVVPVTRSRRVKVDGVYKRVPFDPNKLIIMVQPKNLKNDELKSKVYYEIRSDGSLAWVPTGKVGTKTVSLRPLTGESYNFKKYYSDPAKFFQGLKETPKVINNKDKIRKNQERVVKLTEKLGDINDTFVQSFDLTDTDMHMRVKIYNPKDESTFIAKFRLDEKSRWIIDKSDFNELDPSEQDVLEEFGVRGGKKMSRAYFLRRIKRMAKQDKDNVESLNPVSRFFRNVGKKARQGWTVFKSFFGY